MKTTETSTTRPPGTLITWKRFCVLYKGVACCYVCGTKWEVATLTAQMIGYRRILQNTTTNIRILYISHYVVTSPALRKSYYERHETATKVVLLLSSFKNFKISGLRGDARAALDRVLPQMWRGPGFIALVILSYSRAFIYRALVSNCAPGPCIPELF